MRRSTARLPTLRQLLQDVAAGIRVLKSRDGVPLSEEQVLERARNIVTGLVGNYRILSIDPGTPRPASTVEQLNLLAALDPAPAEITGSDPPAP